MIEDTASVSVDDVLDNQKMRSAIVSSLSRLSKREEQVLRLRFGITDIENPEEFEIKKGEI
jgi:DNA-directed RNA polymerase sigma subunit (sigma70/sigma32)